jgi:hypothetical protein
VVEGASLEDAPSVSNLGPQVPRASPIMDPNSPLVPLHFPEHASKGWRRFDSYSFASVVSRAPIATPEIASIVLSYPVAFESTVRGTQLVAVLDLHTKRNLFVNGDGRWLARYVPAYFRSFPFVLPELHGEMHQSGFDPSLKLTNTGNTSNDRRELLVHLSEILPVERHGVTPFFADQDFHPLVVETLAFLRKFHHGVRELGRIGEKLKDLRVLRPWMIEVKDVKQTAHPSQSTEASSSDFRAESADPPTLYCVDETRLNALSDEDWLVLRHHGALPIVFAQLMSMGQLATLRQLHKLRTEDAGLLAPSPASKRQVSNAGEDSLRDFIDAVVQSQ